MPKIREYTQQVEAAGPVRAPQLRGSDISAAGGLSSIGRGLSDVADYVEEREVFEARKDMVREQLETRKEISEMERTAPPGAEGFDERVNVALEKRREKLQEKYSSGKASRFVSQTLDDFQSSVKFGAYEFKARSQGMKDVTDYKDLQAEQQNLLRANPALLKESLKAQADLVAGMRIDESKKFELLKETTAQLYDSSLDGRVSKLATSDKTTIGDVDSMIAQMKNKDGEWVKNNSKPAYDAQLSRLEQLKEHLNKKREAFIDIDIKEKIEQNSKTGTYPGKDKGLYSPEWIKANVKDPVKQASLLEQWKIGEAEGQANTFIQSKGIAAAFDSAKKASEALPGSPDFNPDSAYAKTLQAQATQALKEFQEDPAGKTNELSTTAKTLWDSFKESPSPERYQRWLDSSRVEQDKQVPGAPKSVYPKELALEDKALFEKIGQTADGGEKFLDHLRKRTDLVGPKNAPGMIKEMTDRYKVIPPAVAIAANMDRKPENRALAVGILKAQSMKNEELEKLAPPGALGRVRTSLQSGFAGLQKSLFGVGPTEAASITEKYVEAASKAAIVLAPFHGETPEAMAPKLAAAMANDDYVFKDFFRVPKTADPDNVIKATKILTKDLNPTDLAPPTDRSGRTMSESQEVYANRLKSSGRWVTTGDESGLEFRTEDNVPVLRKDGNPIRLTWDQLKTVGAAGKADRKWYQVWKPVE